VKEGECDSLACARRPAWQTGFLLYKGTGYCRPSVSPPTRFVSAQLLGGLKILYKRLGDMKNLAPYKKHVQGSQTDPEGKFQPCYPSMLSLILE